MHSKCKLGHANPKTGYFFSYHSLFLDNPQFIIRASSAEEQFYSLPRRYPFNKEHAVRFRDLHHHSDSVFHSISGSQHQSISRMITELHSIACSLMMKATFKSRNIVQKALLMFLWAKGSKPL